MKSEAPTANRGADYREASIVDSDGGHALQARRWLRFGLRTLFLLTLAVALVGWFLAQPTRTIQKFRDDFARGDLAAVSAAVTNGKLEVDAEEGCLMRHFSSGWQPNNWADDPQSLYRAFETSHIVAHPQSFWDWLARRRTFQFASAHTRTEPDRTMWSFDGSTRRLEKFWDYDDPITGERVVNWSYPGDHNVVFRTVRFLVQGSEISLVD